MLAWDKCAWYVRESVVYHPEISLFMHKTQSKKKYKNKKKEMQSIFIGILNGYRFHSIDFICSALTISIVCSFTPSFVDRAFCLSIQNELKQEKKQPTKRFFAQKLYCLVQCEII